MTQRYDIDPSDESPTYDEQSGEGGFVFGQNDHAELCAWIDRKETPISDAEADQQWCEEMQRRERAAELVKA